MSWLRNLFRPPIPGIATFWYSRRRGAGPDRRRFVVLEASADRVHYRMVPNVGEVKSPFFSSSQAADDCSLKEFARWFEPAPDDEEPSWTSPV